MSGPETTNTLGEIFPLRIPFQKILEGVADGITVLNQNGEFVYANLAGARLCGFNSVEEFLATGASGVMSRFELYDENGQKVAISALPGRRALRGESSEEIILHHYDHATQESVWSAVSASPVRDDKNNVTHAISIFRNITAQKQSEKHLRESENNFRLLAETLPQLVWTATPAGTMEYCNQRFLNYCGELRGHPTWLGAVHPKKLAEVEQRWLQSLRTHQGYIDEFPLRRCSDGTYRWHTLSITPVLDSSKSLLRWLVTFSDCDDKKRAEDAKNFLMEVGTTLSSSLDSDTILKDLCKFLVPQVSDWCAVEIVDDQTGYLRRVAVAHPDPHVLATAPEQMQDDGTALSQNYGKYNVLRTGKAELYPDVQLFIKDHQISSTQKDILAAFSVRSVMLVPLCARGRNFGVLTFVNSENRELFNEDDLELAENIARKAAMAVDNARLYREAQTLNRTKDEFLATLSHELRTPMNVILGWIQLLRDANAPEDLWEQALATLERNAHHQIRLISDILDVSRIVTGKLRLDPVELKVSQVVESAVESIELAARAKGIAIEKHVGDSGMVWADASRLHQIIWNLLSNAIKFTPNGGHILIESRTSNDSAEIKVTDSGDGIDPRFLPHVFDRFRQEDSTTTRKHGGLGLGLGLVRYLSELHGGSVQASSAGKGLGSCFTVKLPLSQREGRIHEPPTSAASAPSAEASGSSKDVQSTQNVLKNLTCVVVDDSPDVLFLTSKIIQRHGATAVTFDSVDTALSYLEQRPPDLLLSDIGMPTRDGYDLIRAVRLSKVTALANVPAIALTAYAREEDRDRALQAGYNLHIPKPILPATLIKTIAQVLNVTQAI